MKRNKIIALLTIISMLGTTTGCDFSIPSDFKSTLEDSTQEIPGTTIQETTEQYTTVQTSTTEKITTRSTTTTTEETTTKANETEDCSNELAQQVYDILSSHGDQLDMLGTGAYVYGNCQALDSILEENFDLIKDGETENVTIQALFCDFELLSTLVYMNDDSKIICSCYPCDDPLDAAERVKDTNKPLLYEVCDDEGKAKYNNFIAYQLCMSIAAISSEYPIDAGDYNIYDVDTIVEHMPEYLSDSYWSDLSGNALSDAEVRIGADNSYAVVVSMYGDVYGGYPENSTVDNCHDFTLDDAEYK